MLQLTTDVCDINPNVGAITPDVGDITPMWAILPQMWAILHQLWAILPRLPPITIPENTIFQPNVGLTSGQRRRR